MRFLLLNQFYPPDPAPTGWYLHGLARELVGRGHHVSVLCSRRSYDGKDSYPRRENLEGVEVSRLPATGFGRRGFVGKMADYGTFYFSLATGLDLIFDNAAVSGSAGKAGRRKARVQARALGHGRLPGRDVCAWNFAEKRLGLSFFERVDAV
jgi:hypothetical protein